MDQGKELGLEGVERTMLLPLWGRWTESVKPDGLIRDGKCLEVARRLGLDMDALGRGQNPASRLAWVARAWNQDRELRAAMAGGPLTVLCLGSGLDTAFWRVDDGKLRWIDMDLPAAAELRGRLLDDDAAGRVERVAGSALDPAAYRGLEVRGRLMVTALGLLYYFDAEGVRRVFSNIASLGLPATVLIDYCSATGVAVSNKAVLQGCPGARMLWSAESEAELAALHPGLKVAEAYPLFKKILPLLGPDEARMAAGSDALRIMSFARLELPGA